MSTPLVPPVSPGSKESKALEMEKLQQQYDQATGRAPAKPQPWHSEKGLSKATKEALDALEPKPKSGGFYKEDPKMAARQDAFDQAARNVPAQGAGTWQAGPVSKKDRLLAWHKALGTPKHVVDAEVKALEEQEGKA